MTSISNHVARLYAHLKAIIQGIHLDRSIGLDSIAMLVLVAALALTRAMQ